MSKSIRITRTLALSASAGAMLALGACSDNDFDLSRQFGADPALPEPTSSILPAMKVATVVGWAEGETPTVPEGLTVTPYAQDLGNPRTVHTLPNGDVLVVQSKEARIFSEEEVYAVEVVAMVLAEVQDEVEVQLERARTRRQRRNQRRFGGGP